MLFGGRYTKYPIWGSKSLISCARINALSNSRPFSINTRYNVPKSPVSVRGGSRQTLQSYGIETAAAGI
jgi:hypothetical protein